jgi:predicted secreted protein
MAGVSGHKATVSYKGGNVAGINNWTLNISNNTLEVSAFSTSATNVHWKTFIAGANEWSGNISGFWDSASTGQGNLRSSLLTPTTGTLILETDQSLGGKYSGDVVLTGLTESAALDGTVDFSIDFTGNNAVAYTTTT